ncbi:MAG: NAD(+)/NADH kinase [Desulfohalobiaceae bacterium]|nr:NAD(+)/NADH kinase [Desulfohalobiaceae bacterium]
MEHSFSQVAIVTKERHDQARELGDHIGRWLTERGVGVQILANEQNRALLPLEGAPPDLILVLGGDGTVLSVARKLDQGPDVPLLGLNLGQIGFLTELSPEGWREGLAHVLEGGFSLFAKVILQYNVQREGRTMERGKVVNDLVVGRSGLARLIGLRMWCNAEELGRIRADGMIVSTPIGSTAYAVAAGGALVSPDLRAMELCPVSPFMSCFRPLILGSGNTVTIEVDGPSGEALLTLDGQAGNRLESGDRVVISEAERPLRFVQPSGNSYIQKLRNKGYLG